MSRCGTHGDTAGHATRRRAREKPGGTRVRSEVTCAGRRTAGRAVSDLRTSMDSPTGRQCDAVEDTRALIATQVALTIPVDCPGAGRHPRSRGDRQLRVRGAQRRTGRVARRARAGERGRAGGRAGRRRGGRRQDAARHRVHPGPARADRRLPGTRRRRVLLVVTFRPEEPGPRPLFAALARLPHVTRLDLPPLSPAEVADQVRGILGDADAAAARNAHARGGGNPLFVEALVTTPGEAVPGSLRDLLLGRVRRLPGPARAAVRAARCAGDRAGHALLAAVTGLPDADLGEALRPAADHGLLIADGDGYAFRHALIREAVHGDLLPGARSALPRRYAEAVERRPDLSDTPESALAVHWQACGDHARALAAAWRAAGERGAAAAHAERLTLLERVLDLWDRVPDAASLTGAARREVLEAAAEAAGAAGDPGRGLPLVRRALEETHRDREPGRAARLLVLRAQLRGQQGHEDELDDLREAARLVPGPLPARVEVLARLSSRLVVHGEMDEGERLAREGAQLAAALGMGTARLWLETTAAAAAARDGDGDTAPLERLRRRGLGASQTVNVLNTLTHCRLSTRHPAGGLAAADEALALAARAGLAHSHGPAPAVNRVEALYRLGRWDEAGAARLARRIARRAGRAGLTGPSGGPL